MRWTIVFGHVKEIVLFFVKYTYVGRKGACNVSGQEQIFSQRVTENISFCAMRHITTKIDSKVTF